MEQSTHEEAAAELRAVWALLNRPAQTGNGGPTWPSLTDVANNDVRNSNYLSLFESTGDVKASPKVLCANGVICSCRIEWFENERNRYSGMFRRGFAESGILRMSSALGDISGTLPVFAGKISQSKLFPCVAIKLFRGRGHPSANLVFGGKKTGQPEWNFFEHSVCTNLTEKVSFWLQWVIGLFRLYSSFPTQSGLSEFAMTGTNGIVEQSPDVKFPWCLLLRPVYCNSGISSESDLDNAEDDKLPPYMLQLLRIPSGAVLYDVFAIPDPTAALKVLSTETSTYARDCSHLQRIGRVMSTSPCIWSVYDRELCFRHQRKEDDYAIRSDWFSALSDDHRNIGAANIDKLIDGGFYQDFEI